MLPIRSFCDNYRQAPLSGYKQRMTCPHCQTDIDDVILARHMASKGGKKSRRTLTPDQQAMMRAAKKSKKSKP